MKTVNNWLYWCMLLVLVTLFLSRAALSISSIVFCLIATLSKDFKIQLKYLVKDRVLLSMTMLFFIPFISFFWSENVAQWVKVIQLKLPFLFLPLAFAGNWQLTTRQWGNVAMLFVVLISVAAGWSLSDYLLNLEHYNLAYLKAKLIRTPLENDHVRFSWIVVVAIMISFLLYERVKGRSIRILLLLVSVFLIGFIHLLAARLGLICLYIFLVSFATWKLVQSKKKIWIVLVGCILLLPVIAWFSFPTFQNRIKYVRYDINEVKSGNYYTGSNDGARILSMKAGWSIMKQKAWGAGAGDLQLEVSNWYNENAPSVLEKDRFYPSNEWLMYGGYAGWSGLVIFSLVMIVPFLFSPRFYKYYWYLFIIMAVWSFMVDMGLEVQYGIFLYSFLLLCLYKCFNIRIDA